MRATAARMGGRWPAKAIAALRSDWPTGDFIVATRVIRSVSETTSAAIRWWVAAHIRDELLRERAEALLRERRVSIGEVSYLLGYAEPSNFHRAFRRWTGFTPAEWRGERV